MKNYVKHYEFIANAMEELGGKIPNTMTSFGELHEKTITQGVLSSKVKELIALGIAITVRCDGCIAFHVHDALKAGATNEEIMETIGVAILMGGGPSVVYGCEAMEALKQFNA
ncbi:carboxymuconolactone decarboxylase family protein [Tenacibaculum sp. IB213877]|uniref:carboxymuconolactone decarboxylase family protein n=1 Tax=Tenacibaculum sp. IB213877 TaxID=3097351 RepID=UPI002A59B43D|nr:carboxymuconolactone decarboxylase family protein [Tenacibaculum sp. IB213877]MDY0779496.1 carboxymuconolactone decarboxylase family protein [Tenacibaculum sp. IB213877]